MDVESGMLGGDGAVWQQRPSANQFECKGTKGVGVYRQQVPVVVFWRLSEADEIGPPPSANPTRPNRKTFGCRALPYGLRTV